MLWGDDVMLRWGLALADFRYLVLAGLLVIAAISDLKRQRISNRLVLSGLVLALLFHLFFPQDLGLWQGFLGLLVGFAMLLPFYLLRGMAAGDVKLMAMVGAFLGPSLTLVAVVLTFLFGGLWALKEVARQQAWSRLLGNLRHLKSLYQYSSPTNVSSQGVGPYRVRSLGRLPYGVAIAVGTLLTLLVQRSGDGF